MMITIMIMMCEYINRKKEMGHTEKRLLRAISFFD